ncbi:heavy metal-responsive transcriptional regulator [Streptomyces liliifuscus]|uniref:Heavy metal-responsive transcriptional regulator n=1 Tax=Streptomyces liliifuscus TaxID=2797636 RepID=A0A7T7L339_9ACTN|nr:heavy metal-responsive transcriptional regulator [Streptomyces liliifuscus]QQM45499.1 heavy metal-responsive transcriptional regulator [Streptomyces liliifuscus]
MGTYRISQLAERCGVPATTLRFYEDAGLLPAGRTPSGYRVYGEDAVERLGFISSAKLLGLALEEIRELLDVREEGVCAAVRGRMVPLVAGRIAETEGRIADLSAFSAHLAAVHADLSGPAPEGGCGPDCGCPTVPAAAGPATTGPVPVTLSRFRPAAPEPAPEAAPESAAESWREAPVDCTLDGPELEGRKQEWRQLVEQAITLHEIPDGLRLTFPATVELAGRVAALAAAEQSCCSFFDFTLHLDPAALELTVRTPEAAAPLLTDLFGATA